MIINLENFEAYLLDYLEGRLDKALEEELFRFLEQHPGLVNPHWLSSSLPYLTPHSVAFGDKSVLHQPDIVPYDGIDESNYDDYFTEWHEGSLSDDQRWRLAEFLRMNPFLESDFRLIGLMYLKPTKPITYPDKYGLYRKVPRISLHFSLFTRIAAVLLLLLTVGIWWLRLYETETKEPNQSKMLSELPSMSASQVKVPEVDVVDGKTFSPPLFVKNAAFDKHVESSVFEARLTRYDILPEMSMRRKSSIEGVNFPENLAKYDDLNYRLMLAMLLEQQPNLADNLVIRLPFQLTGFGEKIRALHNKSDLISQVNLLGVGVGIYNALTDKEVEIIRDYEDGQLQAFVLQSERIVWRRTMP